MTTEEQLQNAFVNHCDKCGTCRHATSHNRIEGLCNRGRAAFFKWRTAEEKKDESCATTATFLDA